jgi:hypothetical protein
MAAHLPQKISSAQLQRYLNSAALREQLLAQIAKDVNIEPLQADATSVHFFEVVHQQLTEVVRHFIQSQPHALANIIYRVDLHEAKTRELLANPNTLADEALATAILERERKKVVIRNIYSGNIAL